MGTYLEVESGSYFDIPLWVLQSINIENLYGAGRIVSPDEVAFVAICIMGTCFATGHVAGVAAAYQVLNENVDIKKLEKN